MPSPGRIPTQVRRTLDRRFGTAWLRHRLVPVGSGDPIVVYQMGKVGSESVVASLRAAGVRDPVHHVHQLSDDGVRRIQHELGSTWRGPEGAGHLWESLRLRRRLADEAPAAWRVVTLARDPVARNISSFFQLGSRFYGLDHAALAARAADPAVVEELAEVFLHRFREHDIPLRWWDIELRAVFGVDVRDVPFDPERGSGRLTAGRADVTLLTVEHLTTAGPAALGALVGRPDGVPIVERNRGDEKGDYGDVYRRFVDRVVLPDDYLDRLYDHEVTRHLYSPAQLDGFRRRWRRTPAA